MAVAECLFGRVKEVLRVDEAVAGGYGVGIGSWQGMTAIWPRIEKTPGVAGDAARIAGTGLSVWVLENYRRLGWTEARVLANYPTLSLADLVQAWAYAAAHREEIADAIRENEGA